MRSDDDRLQDILDAIAAIEKHASNGRDAFNNDELIQIWIVHHLQVIGEACRAISPEFKDSWPQIPWAKIAGMRNVLVHVYFGVDRNLVWQVVAQDLDPLKAQANRALGNP